MPRRLWTSPLGPAALRVRLSAARAAELARRAPRWAAMARTRPASHLQTAVFYGHEWIPGRGEAAHGGTVKFQSLQDVFPNRPRDWNLLYVGASTIPPDAAILLRLARRRRAAVVWNQAGVASPGWHGPGWQGANKPLAQMLHAADHVFFQSEFSKLGSDLFLGERRGPWEVLYNPVDTARFTPEPRPPGRPLTILLGGNQYQHYRFDSAVRAFAHLAREHPEARLLVSGRLSWTRLTDLDEAYRSAARLLSELAIADRVELVGTYTQLEAPELMRRADVLVHTKYNDPCPGVVIEAMACGLPVVYSSSGGVPELVGPEAGIGIPAPLDWEKDHSPEPELLARALAEAAERLPELSSAARARAVERFDVRPWIERHREVFRSLL